MSAPVLLVVGDSSCSGAHREDEVNEPVSASAAMVSVGVALLLTRPSRGHVVVVIGCPNMLTVNHAISHGKRLRSTAQSLYFVFQSPDLFLVMHPLGFDHATLCLQLLCIASLKDKSQRQLLLSNQLRINLPLAGPSSALLSAAWKRSWATGIPRKDQSQSLLQSCRGSETVSWTADLLQLWV